MLEYNNKPSSLKVSDNLISNSNTYHILAKQAFVYGSKILNDWYVTKNGVGVFIPMCLLAYSSEMSMNSLLLNIDKTYEIDKSSKGHNLRLLFGKLLKKNVDKERSSCFS